MKSHVLGRRVRRFCSPRRRHFLTVEALTLIKANKAQQLHVSATDLDISVSSGHPCSVVKEGWLAVPAKQVHETARRGRYFVLFVFDFETRCVQIAGIVH